MPIISDVSVTHTLIRIEVDMAGPFLVATFAQTIDGQGNGTRTLHIGGAAFGALLGMPASAGKSRADDITDAIYAHAIASGQISGVIA